MEVITRTERRRTYNDAEKAAVLTEALVPGVTVRELSRRLGIAENFIYNWRSAQQKTGSIASEPLQFTLYCLTNSHCAAAIHLYEKLGFRHDAVIMTDYGALYVRWDVAMRYTETGKGACA